MKSSFAERLNEALLMRKMRPSNLAEVTGISKGAISEYMKGHYSPKQKAIYIMARALWVDPAWLMGYDTELEPTKPVKWVPLLKEVTTLHPPHIDEDIEGQESTEDMDIDYALRVHGDTMIGSRIHCGDIVYVSVEEEYHNSDVVVARIKDAETIIARYYQYTKAKLILRPDNPVLKEMEFDAKDVKILGKVKQVKFDL